MITTPSNPTGVSISGEELDAICTYARSHDAWRIVDETYLGIADPTPQGARRQTVLACFTPELLEICEQRRLALVEPDGAFYVYFEVSRTGLGSWEFCERALDQVHLALTAGRDFETTEFAESHVRLSDAASREELARGLERLERLVDSLEVGRARSPDFRRLRESVTAAFSSGRRHWSAVKGLA